MFEIFSIVVLLIVLGTLLALSYQDTKKQNKKEE